MTVDKMIEGLQKYQKKGHGNLEIIATHVSMARNETYSLDQIIKITTHYAESSLFGAIDFLTEDEEYVVIYLT